MGLYSKLVLPYLTDFDEQGCGGAPLNSIPCGPTPASN